MVNFEQLLAIDSREEFDVACMELFAMQAVRCKPYAEYLQLLGIEPHTVHRAEDIPHLPIELFKSRDVYCAQTPPEVVFTSSNTGHTTPSRHPMASLALYEQNFTAAFERFYGAVEQYSIYALLPNYLQREGSSLVYMADRLIRRCGSGGFYLDNYEQLLSDMRADTKPKILLGVTYALLDLAEKFAPTLHDTIVMETGGMKGYRKEMPKEKLHEVLCRAFGVGSIHSEYGMAELSSQAYSDGKGIFRTPPWLRVEVRDVSDPFRLLADGRRGGINLTDLGNIYSCAFIETQDMGVRYADGSFCIDGRITGSDIRGCNLLVQ